MFLSDGTKMELFDINLSPRNWSKTVWSMTYRTPSPQSRMEVKVLLGAVFLFRIQDDHYSEGKWIGLCIVNFWTIAFLKMGC